MAMKLTATQTVLRSYSAAKGFVGQRIPPRIKAVYVEEVDRKWLSSVLIGVSSTAYGYISCALKQKDEYNLLLEKENLKRLTTKERYLQKLKLVNSELMKLVREK